MNLAELGWDEGFAQAYAAWEADADVQPGRVAVEFNYIYRVYLQDEEVESVLAGRLKHQATRRSQMPAVGDWVAVRRRHEDDRGTIVGILPRRSWFSRKAAGNITDEQIVAANVDVIFIVMSLDADFSLRRLERYLLLARESGAAPVVLLTKPDLVADASLRAAEVAAVTGDGPVHILSPKLNEGLDQVAQYLRVGRTGALLGSSGVGKSTIINRLAGSAVQKTRAVRAADSKGRHTTTHRELVVLPGGGLIIDTPGMRELQLWDVGEAVRETFDDIETLAGSCHFTNCRHRDEPRCAVKDAVSQGALAADRLDSYLKLQEELARLADLQDVKAQLDEKRRGRIGAKALRQHLKSKRG
jgi:ribosome biogenesis GTPase / thiamine phosphate phosphatase